MKSKLNTYFKIILTSTESQHGDNRDNFYKVFTGGQAANWTGGSRISKYFLQIPPTPGVAWGKEDVIMNSFYWRSGCQLGLLIQERLDLEGTWLMVKIKEDVH